MRFIDLTMASLGAIIGSGWLFGVLYAAHDAGPASIISWVIGGIAVLLIGLIYAELGGLLPESGGSRRSLSALQPWQLAQLHHGLGCLDRLLLRARCRSGSRR